METPRRVFDRSTLLARILGEEADVFERTIDTHIKNLRHKIEADPGHPRYILTVRGIGYKFNEDADV